VRKVATAGLHQPGDVRVLSPPPTPPASPCFVVPAGVCREEGTPGFILPSPAVREEKESSALLKECGFTGGRGALVGLFSAVLKGFSVTFWSSPWAPLAFAEASVTSGVHKRGKTVVCHFFLHPPYILSFPHQA